MGILYNLVIVLGLFFGTESEYNSLSQTEYVKIETEYNAMSGLVTDDDGN